MAEAIETMAARLGDALARLGQMQETILGQQSRINLLESEAGSSKLLVERTASTNERMVEAIEKLGEKGSTVDSKGVGKPFTFASDEARFAAWQKKLRNYVAAALPGARVFMDWAGDHSQPISREELEDRFGEQLRLLN